MQPRYATVDLYQSNAAGLRSSTIDVIELRLDLNIGQLSVDWLRRTKQNQ